MQEGALALAGYELWEEVPIRPRFQISSSRPDARLKERPAFVTVPRMPAPSQTAAAARRRRAQRSRRASPEKLRRLLVLVIVVGSLLGTLLVAAFSRGAAPALPQALPSPANRLLPTGPPTPLTVALRSALRIQMPVQQSRVTAIGYHSAADGALALTPLGRQGNEGALSRLAHKLFGGGHGRFVYYQLSGGATDVLDVGAAPGTDVYAPVDGTVVGLTPFILNGRPYGVRIDIQPTVAPSLVLSLTQLEPDPALTVGSTVAASSTKVGRVIDLSGVETQALARYTTDAGNHVSIELRPAATLTLP